LFFRWKIVARAYFAAALNTIGRDSGEPTKAYYPSLGLSNNNSKMMLLCLIFLSNAEDANESGILNQSAIMKNFLNHVIFALVLENMTAVIAQ